MLTAVCAFVGALAIGALVTLAVYAVLLGLVFVWIWFVELNTRC